MGLSLSYSCIGDLSLVHINRITERLGIVRRRVSEHTSRNIGVLTASAKSKLKRGSQTGNNYADSFRLWIQSSMLILFCFFFLRESDSCEETVTRTCCFCCRETYLIVVSRQKRLLLRWQFRCTWKAMESQHPGEGKWKSHSEVEVHEQ